jgi:hypothetical protein
MSGDPRHRLYDSPVPSGDTGTAGVSDRGVAVAAVKKIWVDDVDDHRPQLTVRGAVKSLGTASPPHRRLRHSQIFSLGWCFQRSGRHRRYEHACQIKGLHHPRTSKRARPAHLFSGAARGVRTLAALRELPVAQRRTLVRSFPRTFFSAASQEKSPRNSGRGGVGRCKP